MARRSDVRLRPALLRLHRWVGLSLAGFLMVAGPTGSVAAFHETLDGWLNPDLFVARPAGPDLSPAAMAARLLRQRPHVRLGYLVYRPEQGRSAHAYVQPATDPVTGAAYPLAQDELFLDPVSGAIQGARSSDACCLGRRALIPFLYRVHYTLGLGRTGVWIMGIVAIVWSIDCVVGLLLTLPGKSSPWQLTTWRRWGLAWRIGSLRRGIRLTFDLHRAVSLWLWIVLLGVAVSGVSLTLDTQVFRPVVAWLLPVTSDPPPAAAPSEHGIGPGIGYDAAEAIAIDAAARTGWHGRPDSLYDLPQARTVRFYFAGARQGGAGLGGPTVAIDMRSGRVLQVERPGQGRAGDLVLQVQFPWHSGRIAGLAGRIVIAITGIAVPMLVVTGIMIWRRKQLARAIGERRRGAVPR